MVTKLRLVFSITIVFLSFYGAAQSNYWKEAHLSTFDKQVTLQKLSVEKGMAFTLDEQLFKQELLEAKTQKSVGSIVYFPDEKGTPTPFKVVETQLFSQELAEKYPDIKSYRGVGLTDKLKKINFSVSHKGVQSMMNSLGDTHTLFMQKGNGSSYILYQKKDGTHKDSDFVCKTSEKIWEGRSSLTAKLVDDQALTKFRIAIATSGEYTTFHGGTKADALAAINVTLTRVNEIFERDLGVTLELIGNTDDVIYLDPDTDPFSSSLSSEAQNTFTSVIGEANYDIGHLFNQKDGTLDGNAGFIGSVCVDNRKGSGYTTLSNPVGDAFDIDLVAHEIGHQFGANHTFSHFSEGTDVQVEPASGTTIMAYAGITGDNDVAPNSDDYFHYKSIVQIREYLETVSCGVSTTLTNTPPVLNEVQDYIIPKGTAFVLTGDATDTDIDDVISYTWEQIDNGIVTQATFGPTNPVGALFRSLPGTTAPERYFPSLERVLSGNLTQTNPNEGDAWETVSTVERNLNFSLTVRDNALSGGQAVSDEVSVFVSNDAGPFAVSSQSVVASFVAGEVQTITWEVADTNVAPISAETVDIFLSTDGGLTYPITLAQDVLNNGSHNVIIPSAPTTSGRIMIKAPDNIFFAVNDVDFSITETEVVLNFSELEPEVCKPDDITVNFDYETYLGFAEESTFSVVSPPVGLTAVISPETATTTNTPVSIDFSGIGSLNTGVYPITIRSTSASITQEVTFQLRVYDTDFSEVVLTAPIDGLQDASRDLLLQWEENVQYTAYDVEIATDLAFTNIIEAVTVSTTSYPPTELENNTEYFWRVKPKNNCGEGTFGTPNSFTTAEINCKISTTLDVPIAISSTGTPTITSKIAFYEDLQLDDINVTLDIEHTFLADLVISLTSPAGNTVVLVSASCSDSQDINAVFDDDVSPFVCSGTPAINGTVKPLGSLDSFKGESILGEWILEVKDNAASDGGRLNSFSLEVCVVGDFRPDDDNDGIFDDGDDLCPGTPEGQEVDTSGCPIYRFSNDNFNISLESESCRDNNDGQLQITPKTALNYEVQVVGVGIDVTQNFTNLFSLSDLSAGTYTVCINGTDGTIVYEELCLEIVITQPEVLSVSSKTSLNGKLLTVSMQGSEIYTIELNGELTQTEASEITLNLEDGVNALKVSTNLSCQGVYEEQFVVSNDPIVFPNPFLETVDVLFANISGSIDLSVFTVEGKLVKKATVIFENGSANLVLDELASGLYFLQFAGDNIKGTTKVIKR